MHARNFQGTGKETGRSQADAPTMVGVLYASEMVMSIEQMTHWNSAKTQKSLMTNYAPSIVGALLVRALLAAARFCGRQL